MSYNLFFMKIAYMCIAMLFAIPLNSYAALGLKSELAPEFKVSAGQSIQSSITIYNSDSKPIEVSLTQHNKTANQAMGNQRSNRAWIKISANRLIVPPKSRKTINYSIQVPTNVGTGSYWSSITVAPIKADSKESSLTPEKGKIKFLIKQNVQYEIQVVTNIGTGEPKLNFSAPKLEKNQSNQKVFGINIKNSGNFHAQTKVSLEVFRANGQRVGLLQGNTRGLYPGAQKRFEVNVANLSVGQYKALLLATDTKTGRNFGVDVNLNIQP